MAEGCEGNEGLVIAVVILSLSTTALIGYILYIGGYLDFFWVTPLGSPQWP